MRCFVEIICETQPARREKLLNFTGIELNCNFTRLIKRKIEISVAPLKQ